MCTGRQQQSCLAHHLCISLRLENLTDEELLQLLQSILRTSRESAPVQTTAAAKLAPDTGKRSDEAAARAVVVETSPKAAAIVAEQSKAVDNSMVQPPTRVEDAPKSVDNIVVKSGTAADAAQETSKSALVDATQLEPVIASTSAEPAKAVAASAEPAKAVAASTEPVKQESSSPVELPSTAAQGSVQDSKPIEASLPSTSDSALAAASVDDAAATAAKQSVAATIGATSSPEPAPVLEEDQTAALLRAAGVLLPQVEEAASDEQGKKRFY